MLVMCYELHITNIGTFNFKTINTTPSLCCDNSFHFFSGRGDGIFHQMLENGCRNYLLFRYKSISGHWCGVLEPKSLFQLIPQMFTKVQNWGLVQASQFLPQHISFKIISIWTSPRFVHKDIVILEQKISYITITTKIKSHNYFECYCMMQRQDLSHINYWNSQIY